MHESRKTDAERGEKKRKYFLVIRFSSLIHCTKTVIAIGRRAVKLQYSYTTKDFKCDMLQAFANSSRNLCACGLVFVYVNYILPNWLR